MRSSNLIPILFFIVMVLNIYIDRMNRRKRRAKRRQQQDEQTDFPRELPPDMARPEDMAETKQSDDIVAEFERRLKKTTETAEAAKQQKRDRVVSDRQYIHRDDEKVVHDNAGRVHRENESLVHDKGKIYYDPRSDYSYSEEQMNAAAAAFNAHYAKAQEPEKKPRVQLKHKALVNGLIMSEVLGKPRSLNPYGDRQ